MSDALHRLLRERFQHSAAGRLTEMRAAIAILETNPVDEAALELLARHFHALAGMGGTYGFPRISELGDDAEQDMALLVRVGAPPGEADVARWRTVMQAIERQLASEKP